MFVTTSPHHQDGSSTKGNEGDNWSQLESTHPSRTSVKSDQGFFGVESVMRVNADSLLIRAAATSTSGTLNDLTTDLIMANNNNNKETIFTRHYQTVLPLLANNRKDTLQALHTSFVNIAIGNMKDNRVLNSRPPSINDEETLLQRRQRTTLSQLRSGHCKLLNSYKKRLKQSDSSRCPDCGMDPQDVPHLFDCVAHHNDLSPVNLWDKPIETIRELSVLDPGNLN